MIAAMGAGCVWAPLGRHLVGDDTDMITFGANYLLADYSRVKVTPLFSNNREKNRVFNKRDQPHIGQSQEDRTRMNSLVSTNKRQVNKPLRQENKAAIKNAKQQYYEEQNGFGEDA